MNNNFTNQQIEAYANTFGVGDAVWCDGKWYEVLDGRFNKISPRVDSNPYVLNKEVEGKVVGVLHGFIEFKPYRVTTLEQYKPKRGDKVVWLGKTTETESFGKIYNIHISINGQPIIIEDKGRATTLVKGMWGVIPKWSNIEKQYKETNSIIVEQNLNTNEDRVKEVVKHLVDSDKYLQAISILELLVKGEEQYEF